MTYPFQQPQQEMCLVGAANPFTDNWVPAEVNIYQGGQNPVWDTAISRGVSWWNLTVFVLGETYSATDPLPITSREQADTLCTQARNSGNKSSILKVEVTYPVGNSRQRTYRFDVESGRDVVVPPTWKATVRFLQPVVIPSENPLANPVPAGFTRDLFYISDLVIAARCVQEIPRLPGGSWTSQLIIADAGNAIREFQVEEGAIAVEACFDIVPTNPLQFVWQRRDIVTGAVIDETVLGTAAPIPPSTCIPRTEIPAGTNLIRYSQPAGPFPIQGTIIQHLEF